MDIWTLDGRPWVDATGRPIDCPECSCHESACNPNAGVPKTLDFVINFGPHTLPVTLTWISSSSSCFGQPGWEYTGGDAAICSGLSLQAQGVALCCGGSTWSLEVVFILNGVPNFVLSTSGGGLQAVNVASQSPVHYTTQSTGSVGACTITEDILIDIQG